MRSLSATHVPADGAGYRAFSRRSSSELLVGANEFAYTGKVPTLAGPRRQPGPEFLPQGKFPSRAKLRVRHCSCQPELAKPLANRRRPEAFEISIPAATLALLLLGPAFDRFRHDRAAWLGTRAHRVGGRALVAVCFRPTETDCSRQWTMPDQAGRRVLDDNRRCVFATLWIGVVASRLVTGSELDQAARYAIAIDGVVLLPLTFFRGSRLCHEQPLGVAFAGWLLVKVLETAGRAVADV